MKYIFLAIVLFLISILVYINFYNKNKKIKEGLDLNNQENYLKKQDKYYDYRKFPQLISGGNEDSKFVDLNLDKTKLIDKSPSANVIDSELAKKIEKCKIIDKTKDCSLIEESDCGYCWHSDKIMYGDNSGPKADVCPKNGWVPPGPQAAAGCLKKKERALCNTMVNCGDSTGEKSICGWCPLKNKGVPKKKNPNGKGWVAKYPEDECDWKSKVKEILGPDHGLEKCNDLKTKLPSQFGSSRKWHDRDGKYYDCEEYAKGNNCKYWGNGYVYQELTGNKACCVCGGGEKGIPFDGNLISPDKCEKFKQLFPCVGPNMFTGPHTPQCLSGLWKRSGCTGDLNQRVRDQNDYSWWNSHSYGDALRNMKSFSKIANTSSDYSNANKNHKKCYGSDVDSCQARFKPRPDSCSKRIYKQTGLDNAGKLNPDNTDTWPTGWVSSWFKSGQRGEWTLGTYKSMLNRYKHLNIMDSINPKKNFDRYILTNQLIKGENPPIPWEKPCWKEFIKIMTSTKDIKLVNNGNLDFSGSGSFKSILPQSNDIKAKSGPKKGMNWVEGYQLKKTIYEMKYFPFWQFIKTNKRIWNSKWSIFKRKMLSVYGVESGSEKKKYGLVWLGSF